MTVENQERRLDEKETILQEKFSTMYSCNYGLRLLFLILNLLFWHKILVLYLVMFKLNKLDHKFVCKGLINMSFWNLSKLKNLHCMCAMCLHWPCRCWGRSAAGWAGWWCSSRCPRWPPPGPRAAPAPTPPPSPGPAPAAATAPRRAAGSRAAPGASGLQHGHVKLSYLISIWQLFWVHS